MAKKKTKEAKKPKPKEEHFIDGLDMPFDEVMKKLSNPKIADNKEDISK